MKLRIIWRSKCKYCFRIGLIMLTLFSVCIPSTAANVKVEGLNENYIYIQDNGLLGYSVKDDVECKAVITKKRGMKVKRYKEYGKVPVVFMCDESVLKISKSFLNRMKNKECGLSLTVYKDKVYSENTDDVYTITSEAFRGNGICKFNMEQLMEKIGLENYEDNQYRFLFYHTDDGLMPAFYFCEFK